MPDSPRRRQDAEPVASLVMTKITRIKTGFRAHYTTESPRRQSSILRGKTDDIASFQLRVPCLQPWVGMPSPARLREQCKRLAIGISSGVNPDHRTKNWTSTRRRSASIIAQTRSTANRAHASYGSHSRVKKSRFGRTTVDLHVPDAAALAPPIRPRRSRPKRSISLSNDASTQSRSLSEIGSFGEKKTYVHESGAMPLTKLDTALIVENENQLSAKEGPNKAPAETHRNKTRRSGATVGPRPSRRHRPPLLRALRLR